jgi:DNA-binding NarL/FixJ family response regulator
MLKKGKYSQFALNIRCSLYLSWGHFLVNNVIEFPDANFYPVRERTIMFKILIVDPNDPFRRSLKKVLINRFPLVEVQEAADGDEGLRIVDALHPDIIFLEIHLPSETGLDLASRIKADHPDIIIVILTSYDLPEYKLAVSKSGIEHMVPKDDWTGEDMIALVQSILADLKLDEHGYQDHHNPRQQTS